ncbi:MAG: vitamin K epoxide reductase family protein [Thermoleophilia bacterium]
MSGELRTAVRIALVLLALVGFLISFYLTLTHYRNAVPPCYVTTGCETVVTSRYAVILGVPLSLIGTLFFALMFYLGIALLTGPSRTVLRAYDLLAFAGILAAVALFLLQAVVLKAYCSYCLATEAIALLLWAGSLVAGSAAEDAGDSGGGGRGRR